MAHPPHPLLLLVPTTATFSATRYEPLISIQIPVAPLLLVEVLQGPRGSIRLSLLSRVFTVKRLPAHDQIAPAPAPLPPTVLHLLAPFAGLWGVEVIA